MDFYLTGLAYTADLLSSRSGSEAEEIRAFAAVDDQTEIAVPGRGRVTRGMFHLRKRNAASPVSPALHYNGPDEHFSGSSGGWFAGWIEVDEDIFDRFLRVYAHAAAAILYMDLDTSANGFDFVAPDAFRWDALAHPKVPILNASVQVRFRNDA